MARQNFLWGAPRIHDELLTLGFSVSQATCHVTCLHEADGRGIRGGLFFATKPWRSVTASMPGAVDGDADSQGQSYSAQLRLSGVAQIATVWVGPRRGLAQQQPTLNVARISLRSAHSDCGMTHRAASVSGGSRGALYIYSPSAAAFPIRSPQGLRLP
jgi:hypothetical protein